MQFSFGALQPLQMPTQSGHIEGGTLGSPALQHQLHLHHHQHQSQRSSARESSNFDMQHAMTRQQPLKHMSTTATPQYHSNLQYGQSTPMQTPDSHKRSRSDMDLGMDDMERGIAMEAGMPHNMPQSDLHYMQPCANPQRQHHHHYSQEVIAPRQPSPMQRYMPGTPENEKRPSKRPRHHTSSDYGYDSPEGRTAQPYQGLVGQPGMPAPAKRPRGPKIKFTDADDRLLMELKEGKCLAWKQIAEFFPGRTSGTLQVRYCTKLKAKSVQWGKETILKLRDALIGYEEQRWQHVAKIVGPGFSPSACREKATELWPQQPSYGYQLLGQMRSRLESADTELEHWEDEDGDANEESFGDNEADTTDQGNGTLA